MHRIDPRIVIIQIVLSGICAFWIFKPLAMLCEVLFLMSFLLYLQHPKEALRLGVWFAFLVGLYALLNESNAPQIIVQPVFLLRKLSPLLGVMVLSLKALTVSELFMGLQKLHCPKSATLALAVALRFIPTIRHELEQIRNGMKTRGVPLNVITFAKAPAMTTEYMIILQFASQRKGLLRISVILSVLSSAFGMVPYAAVAVLLGKALDNALTIEWAVGLTLVALAGYFLKHFLYSKSTLCSHKAAYEIIQNIRCAIMRKMSKMSMGTIQEKSSGEFKQLVIDDTERLEGQIAHAIPEMTASILIPIFVFAYLLFVDWRMALASLASAVLGNVIYYSMMIGRSERMKEYMSANGDMNATIVEYVNGMEVIRMFNQTASSMGRFKGAVLKVRDITTAWYKHCYPFMSISQVVMPSTIAFVLPVGVVLLSGGTTTLNEVILCILLSMGLVGSLQAMIEFWHDIAAIYEIQPRIMALLEAKELPEPIEAQHSSGNDVELKDVHFSYGAIEVIHGVSFTAKAGTVTALVGPSGSGKSTLAKLIARFWDVSAGAVTVGGADIRNLPLSELSEKISYVSQDNFLFNMSLRDNIRIGKPDATDAEVERAASLARCDDFIARFPKGYDTNAGDAGARLSGGERQRLAIARAILKDAPIIILDEATAFTDPENEDKLQQSIDHLTKGKTLIVIAHRLSTIMYADKILMLEDGSISAAGTHEQLLSSSQTYLDMWKAHISAMDWSMNKEVEILC